MQIKVAKTAGFCFGVDRAANMVYSLLKENKNVYTLGPIIHNPQLVDDLKKRGAVIVEKPSQVPQGGTIVVRTHGVAKKILDEIEKLGLDCTNATCPFVSKIHKIVMRESEKGNIILIAGNKDHPEVMGIRGYCSGISYVFNNPDELDEIIENHPELKNSNISVVAQTTFSVKIWEKCVKKIKIVYTNAVVFDTICNATEERQREAIELSSKSDIMIIIGGRHSSNTAKLRDVCSENCPTYLIETASELSGINFSNCNVVGVTAGASTPACIIKEVLLSMSDLLNEQPDVVNKVETEANTEEESEDKPEKSIDEMSFSEALEESFKNFSTDQKVQGVVVAIEPNEIQVDIGRKHTGYVPLNELTNNPDEKPEDVVKVGDVLNLIIMKTNDQEGTVMLSKRRFDSIKGWEDIVKASEDNSILDGVVTEVIKGGVLAVTNGVRVFIPASLATASKNEPLDGLLKKNVRFRIIEVNRGRRRAVGSIRSVINDERKEREKAFWETAEVGQKYTGIVKSLTSYGAFVEINGVDGMIHISELSWTRIKHPSEVVNVGDTVEVYIKALDPERKRISLGYKKTEDNPWEILKRDYPVGSTVKAKVVGLTSFGAFAQIIPGIDGLVHISQIADHRIDKPQDVLSIGDEITAKIIDIDFDKKRVSLSIRALIEEAKAAEESVEVKTEQPESEKKDDTAETAVEESEEDK